MQQANCKVMQREGLTMRDVAEARILVTGATDGLGRRVAQVVAAKGATMLLHGRNPERLQGHARGAENPAWQREGKLRIWRTSPR